MDPLHFLFLICAAVLLLWLAYHILLAILLISVLFVLCIGAAVEALMERCTKKKA
jgi:hypothetical protein